MTKINSTNPQPVSADYPITYTLNLLSGRWKQPILWQLRNQPVRYGELYRSLPGISHKILGEQLKALELNGLIKRTEHSIKPLNVDYQLTSWSIALLPLFIAMRTWGRNKLASDLAQTQP